MSFIVSVEWLKEKLIKKNNDIVVIDVRASLNNPDIGEQLYIENHIPSAVYLDLNTDLSGKVKEHGGNHPLPETAVFAEKMSEIGIDDSTHVVIYDAANDIFAARMWWLLYYMGHKNVHVLDGGYKEWVETGNIVTKDVPEIKQTVFSPQIRKNMTADMLEVKGRINQESSVLIDSRAKERYLGLNETMYKKSGHIPGSKSFYWKDVLNDAGLWKNTNELKAHFSSLPKDTEIIVSCGSGISACPNILSLKEAGYKNVKLYPGSFSDWISYPENDLATEEA